MNLVMAEPSVPELVASVQSSNTKDVAFYILSAWLAYWISVFLYRISPLHPLSKIPGPKVRSQPLYQSPF